MDRQATAAWDPITEYVVGMSAIPEPGKGGAVAARRAYVSNMKLKARRKLHSWWIRQELCPKPMDKRATSKNVLQFLKQKLPTLNLNDARKRLNG